MVWRRNVKGVAGREDKIDMRYKRLDIILVVDGRFLKKVLELAGKIGVEEEEVFHIDGKNYFSHVTIYSPEFPESNITEVVKAVGGFVRNTKKFNLVATGFSAEDGFVVVDFEKSSGVEELHRAIVQVLSPFREGRIGEKYLNEAKEGKYSVEQVDMIENYGHPNVLKLYRPHLTLGRLINQEAAERSLKRLENVGETTAQVEKISISEMGPNGTCTNILYEFGLQ